MMAMSKRVASEASQATISIDLEIEIEHAKKAKSVGFEKRIWLQIMASKSYWGNGPDNTAATGLKVVEMNRGKLAGRTTRMADVKTMVCKEKEWTAKTSATLQKQESNWNRTKKEEVGRRKEENLRSQRRRFRFEVRPER
ncbi:hypothetical protein FOMA001_g3434 [Fusarium oxysporum f. sp. matthiolae]|nr:hypothetical protein FOMA001_g3434 [Fusarium oxysporum f. sp. matthiolae]